MASTRSAAQPSAIVAPNRRAFGRVLGGSMAGAILEWYDFAVYGILAATVLGPLFFPKGNAVASLLLALATQGVGFLARPLGGVVFGHLGDKHGRKPILVVTFLLLGIATTSIGLLPTYVKIGMWAPIMLVTLRLVQGFALGGEFGSAILLVAETSKKHTRGFWSALPNTGGPAGTILATAITALLTGLLPGDAFDQWGWRVCFLVALPLLIIGFWIRSGVEESPVYKAAQARQAAEGPAKQKERSSVVEALRKPRPILHGIGLRLGENIAYYVYTIFVIAYATTFYDYPRTAIITVVGFAAACQLVGILLGGWWSDHVGRKRALLVPAVCLIIWAPVFFWLVSLESMTTLSVGVLIGAFLHGCLTGPEAAWISELFPTKRRMAGASLSFQTSSIIAGAPAPFIAVYLANRWGGIAVVGYLVITMAIAVFAAWTSRERGGIPLEAVPDNYSDPVPVVSKGEIDAELIAVSESIGIDDVVLASPAK